MILFTGPIFLVIGLIFKLLPPKKINRIYGYRTVLSMQNQDTWNEAQRYSANSFIVFGLAYCALGYVFDYVIKNVTIGYQGFVLIIGMILMLVIDEGHLRKIFNSDGSKKL